MDKQAVLSQIDQNVDFRFQGAKTLVLKITHRCNTNCSYCYENITSGRDMSLATAKKVIRLLISNSDKKCVTVLFHGGEPTLLSYEWFDEILEFGIEEAKRFNKLIRFSIQTNLINVDERKITLFKKYNVTIGASIDNVDTDFAGLRKRSDFVIDNLRRLLDKEMRIGVLTTINHGNFYNFKNIMSYLYEELNISSFKANPVYNVGAGLNLPSLKPENYFQAYKDMVDYMIETDGNCLIEKNTAIEIMRFFSAENENEFRATLCHEKNCGAGKTVLGITTDGYIFPCGRFQWDDYRFYTGNISESDFDIEKYKASIVNFQDLVPENWYNCQSCQAKAICSYGCKAFISRSLSKANVECLPTQMKFNYFEANRIQLHQVYLRIKKRFFSTMSSYLDKESEEEEEIAIVSNSFEAFSNMYSDSADDSGNGYNDAVDG